MPFAVRVRFYLCGYAFCRADTLFGCQATTGIQFPPYYLASHWYKVLLLPNNYCIKYDVITFVAMRRLALLPQFLTGRLS